MKLQSQFTVSVMDGLGVDVKFFKRFQRAGVPKSNSYKQERGEGLNFSHFVIP